MIGFAVSKGLFSSGRLVTQPRLFQSLKQTSTIFKSNLCSNLSSPYSVRNYGSSILTLTIKSRLSNIRCYCNSLLRRGNLFSCLRVRQFESQPHNVNTNVANNVMLYKHGNTSFFTLINIAGIIQAVCFIMVAELILRTGCTNLFNNELSWKERIKENALSLPIGVLVLLVGPLIYTVIWLFTLRSVKYIVLNKGGNKITIMTHFPFISGKVRTVPLEMVSCKISRDNTRSFVTFKVKDKMFNYILDKKGTFLNPELFDATAGIYRF